jgi:hypothetical protein
MRLSNRATDRAVVEHCSLLIASTDRVLSFGIK